MKTMFDPETHDELLSRLRQLTADSERQWGVMSPSQMMEHNSRVIEMASGAVPMEQHIVGKLIGWAFKGQFLGEKPFSKNAPTGPTMKIADEPDFEAARTRLVELMSAFHVNGPAACDGNVHGFFGKLTGDEWGICQYKHIDHHLRQFGV